ncbi:FAD:protein FMN transferase, partial [Leptospira sp. SA-E8]|uniref:FAD:protein FMN transferase n=1 Tax=Leptospira sp. SA-E8 TaxID=3422259 RepID=UPI003EC0ABAF
MPEAVERRRMRPLLGCFVEVGVHACDENRAESALAGAFSAMEDVQRRLSFHDPESELSRLNGADGRAVPMHVASLRLLRLARALMRASGGLFDVTVGGALVRRGALPDHRPHG